MKNIIFSSMLFASGFAYSASYDCTVTKKQDFDSNYSAVQIEKLKFSVKIHDIAQPKVERCSFQPSANRVTCDSYDIDRVEVDKYVSIKKFYVFKSQFDVQLFPDMTFLENNGRGGIAFGICKPLR
ncbi:hypothetical protein [Polynucleobacter nymphae]|uniref:hypothetical protein n=1 Tax=Polynucleobacter nymphae TaxID=2081043 RepID=UPI001C0D1EB5|nr:hypothetical protein [Polynucleobacter nymphae]MBU3606866.1 hypothetical protein [Polynucleobacter nymphae]